MWIQSQDNGVILMKDQVWSVRMCWILSISGRATWQDRHIVFCLLPRENIFPGPI